MHNLALTGEDSHSFGREFSEERCKNISIAKTKDKINGR